MSKMKEMYLNNDAIEAFEPMSQHPTDEELEEHYQSYCNRGEQWSANRAEKSSYTNIIQRN
jgi:hypothetical protein